MSSDVQGMGNAPDANGARATLEAWSARGADHVNPVRFRFIEALARRAARYEGDARRVLDERLAAWIADYSAAVERAESESKSEAGTATRIKGQACATHGDPAQAPAAHASQVSTQSAPSRGALAELVDLLASRAEATTESEASGPHDALHPLRRDRSPDLPMLDYFRETWSRFSTEKQWRASLEQVPDNAGPLNSHSLMHRALSLMRAVSPGYLRQFLSYAEALSWMEQLSGPGPASGASQATSPIAQTPRAGGAKKRARGKGR
jgi:hypothetical protein